MSGSSTSVISKQTSKAALATSSGKAAAGVVVQKKGLAGGAVAGVAIGSLLAGVLIAGIIFFLLLRRQKKRQAVSVATFSREHVSYPRRTAGPEKGAAAVIAKPSSIEDSLPQPVEDDTISGHLSKIRDNIKNHVRTYYHFEPISLADIDNNSIGHIAALTGVSPGLITKTLLDPTTRNSALRLIVASTILTRCTGEQGPSLLPAEVAALCASIPVSSLNSTHSALYSRVKVMIGVLLSERYGKLNQDSSHVQGLQDTVTSLDTILAPFIKADVDYGQRRKNLDMILTRSANFTFLLFTQPGTFRLDFASRQGDLVIFPALVQIVGDQGQPLTPTKVLTEKEVFTT